MNPLPKYALQIYRQGLDQLVQQHADLVTPPIRNYLEHSGPKEDPFLRQTYLDLSEQYKRRETQFETGSIEHTFFHEMSKAYQARSFEHATQKARAALSRARRKLG
ncbi:hypothetical protein HYV86_02810 [Candidatus Woesearchaeota archaeon]|nr:hypothetical protein [Candidatus Woesearchaeota archaeon]